MSDVVAIIFILIFPWEGQKYYMLTIYKKTFIFYWKIRVKKAGLTYFCATNKKKHPHVSISK